MRKVQKEHNTPTPKCLNGSENTKYIFITLSTYIMSPFDFVYAGMCCHDTVEVDVGALTNRFGVERAAESNCCLWYVC